LTLRASQIHWAPSSAPSSRAKPVMLTMLTRPLLLCRFPRRRSRGALA
jgi:hypothetical protein